MKRSSALAQSARSSILLFVDRVAQVSVTLICTAVIARSVSVDQFGEWQLALSALFVVAALANLAGPDLVIARVAKSGTPERETGAAWTLRAFSSTVTASLVGIVLLLTIANGGENGSMWPLLLLLLLPALVREPGLAGMMSGIGRGEVGPYVAVSIITLCARLAGTLLVALLDVRLEWFVVPIAVETALFTVLMRARLGTHSMPSLRSALNTLPIRTLIWSWLSALLMLASLRADRFVLAGSIDPFSFGLYAAAGQVNDNWFFVGQLLVNGIGPLLVFRTADSVTARRNAFVAVAVVAAVAGLSASILALLAPWVVVILFGTDFAEASEILQLSAFAFALVPVNMTASLLLLRAGRLDLMAAKGAIAITLTVAVTTSLVDQYGWLAAVYGVAIGQGVGIVFAFAASGLRDGDGRDGNADA